SREVPTNTKRQTNTNDNEVNKKAYEKTKRQTSTNNNEVNKKTYEKTKRQTSTNNNEVNKKTNEKTKRQTNTNDNDVNKKANEKMFTEQAKELVNLKKSFKSFKLESRLTGLTFESFKLREEVYNSLRQGVLKDVEPFLPTEIQTLTIPEILKMDNKHILCAAETGSGKTLAYLLPIVNKLKEEEAQSTSYTREEINTEILKVSTEEENQQKYLMSHYAKFRAISITSSKDRRFVKKTLEMPVDIVIATPAGLLEYIDQGYINIADTKYVVIDEADTMFGKGFGEEVQNIINK
ncbi:4741_t:CDS:2, partial [Cetraspora pellucida]